MTLFQTGNDKTLSNTKLKALLWRYPWFNLAKLELFARDQLQSNQVAHLITAGYPNTKILNKFNKNQIFKNNPALISNKNEPLINQPLRSHQLENELLENEDISIESVTEDQNLISETLAQIYAAQGMKDKAITTYKHLSLIFPEKSGYFASKIKALWYN